MSFTKKDISHRKVRRILSQVTINSNTCCMEWGGTIHKGYGRISLNNISEHVHLIIYRHFKGDYDIKRFVIRHSCDNKSCCNPYHLVKGTQSQNIKEWHERRHNEKI